MNRLQTLKPLLTLANVLTCFRFVAAPCLLWFAWHGMAWWFMGLLALGFLSDLLDGFVARWLGQVSSLGARLDSYADVITYLTIALGCWWLWPTVVQRERLYVGFFLASCLLPALIGWLKFKRFTSYHTWGVKFAAATMGLSLYLLFFGDIAWPFRIASIIGLLAALEEIVISLRLSTPESNVRSLWHLCKQKQD